MNILSFDLANFQSSIAIVKGAAPLFLSESKVFRGQDVTLLPLIQKALADNKISIQDIDLIVTTSGPGSFTGIRVALSTAQGLSLATGIPALAIDSFSWVYDAFRHSVDRPVTSDVFVILESMREDLYVKPYIYKSPSVNTMVCKSMMLKQDIQNMMETNYSTAHVIGNGAHHVLSQSIPGYMPNALDLARMAQRIHPKEYQDYPLNPFYLRDPDITKAKPMV